MLLLVKSTLKREALSSYIEMNNKQMNRKKIVAVGKDRFNF